jgi:hypothetical protein
MKGLYTPLGVLSHDVVTDIAKVPGDEEDEEWPANDGDEEDGDESSSHLTLNLDVVLGDAPGEMGGVREFPTIVDFAVGLLEETAVTLKDGASFGFGAVGQSAVLVAEEGLQHLIGDGEGWTLLLHDVHVVVGHDHAGRNLFFGALTCQWFVGGQFKAIAWWQAIVELAGNLRQAWETRLLRRRVCSSVTLRRTNELFRNVCIGRCNLLHARNTNNATCTTAHLFTKTLVAT